MTTGEEWEGARSSDQLNVNLTGRIMVFFPNVGVQEVLVFVKKCFNNEEEIMQTNEVCNHITVSWYDRLLPPFGPSTVCLQILLHLCSQEACLPFV